MKQIQLTQGKIALVDDEDYERLSMFKWFYNTGYACKNSDIQKMHRMINDTPKGFVTDHINGDTLDNRKANLRTATHKQNMANRKVHSNSISGIKGVAWVERNKRWKARIVLNGKDKHLGYFDTPEAARVKYLEAARISFGEFAR